MHHPGVAINTHEHQRPETETSVLIGSIWKQNQDDPCEQSYVLKHWDHMSITCWRGLIQQCPHRQNVYAFIFGKKPYD